MNKFLALSGFLIVIFVGWSALQLWQVEDFSTIDHSILRHSASGKTHDHTKFVILPSNAAAPTLSFNLTEDPAGGWNLNILPSNFRFTPEAINTPHVDGEGHAHVFVNGEKFARVYSNWFHIPTLPKGSITFEVTLNSNMHNPLSVGDKPLLLAKKYLVR